MMYRLVEVVWILLATALSIPGVDAGCTSDVDCKNNFDCIWLGFFLGRACVPKSCAVGAVQAMIDEGFDPQNWVDGITAEAGIRGRDFTRLTNEESVLLQEAYKTAAPPPLDAFTRHYEACTTPKSDKDREQMLRTTFVSHGVQWESGTGCLYTGKSFWIVLRDGVTKQAVQHCLGLILGAQLGASYVARIETYALDLDDASTHPNDPELTLPDPRNITNYCVPIATVGPLQVKICWNPSRRIELDNIVEVSVGARLGASLGGFEVCFYELCSDIPTLSPVTRAPRIDPFEVACLDATRVNIGDSVVDTNVGKFAYHTRQCGDVMNQDDLYPTSGIWYVVTGNGDIITVDTCFFETRFDTQISVWTGPCTNLTCVAGDVGPADSCPFAINEAKVSWASTLGTDYYFYVHGAFSTSTGTFKMLVTVDRFEEACAAATTVNIGASVIDSLDSNDVSTYPSRQCGDAAEVESMAGIWYKVTGDGNTITVDTCFIETEVDTQISVWTGPCSSLTCVAGNDDQGSCIAAKVSWDSTFGTDYYFYMHSKSIFNRGTFKMSVTSSTQAPSAAPSL